MNNLERVHRKYVREFKHTYRQQIADFKLEGDWHLINYFTFSIYAIVNGKPTGYIEGKVTGKNYGYCAVCGTPIIHHYTVQDRNNSKKQYNIGCECIVKILEEDKAKTIVKAINSLRNKITSDYKRPIKHRQLSYWLKAIYEKSDKIRFPQFVKQNRKFFPHITDEQYKEKIKNYPLEAVKYWEFHAKTFPNRDWNPDNMKRKYKAEAEKYGTEHPPSWRRLTTDQQKELNQILNKKINSYINKLKEKDQNANFPF